MQIEEVLRKVEGIGLELIPVPLTSDRIDWLYHRASEISKEVIVARVTCMRHSGLEIQLEVTRPGVVLRYYTRDPIEGVTGSYQEWVIHVAKSDMVPDSVFDHSLQAATCLMVGMDVSALTDVAATDHQRILLDEELSEGYKARIAVQCAAFGRANPLR